MRLSLIVVLLTSLELQGLTPFWGRILSYSANPNSKCNYCKPLDLKDKRNEAEYASLAWGSPLQGHNMKITCPMQDGHLWRRDLSSILVPEWITTHQDPVGRCPVIYRQVFDPDLVWPPILLAAECACERSRCTISGPHRCITVYMAITVHIKHGGMQERLISVDCVCAAQRAKLVRMAQPKIVQ